MVKHLLLLRHCKSSWNHPGLSDIDRPLNGRGIKASKVMGTYLAREDLWPDLILCSSARRTRETLANLEAHMENLVPTRIEQGIYDADRADILERVRDVSADVSSVMVIGHNPTMQDTALDLIGAGDLEAREDLYAKYPTGALALLRLDCEHWRDVRSGAGFLERFICPRDL